MFGTQFMTVALVVIASLAVLVVIILLCWIHWRCDWCNAGHFFRRKFMGIYFAGSDREEGHPSGNAEGNTFCSLKCRAGYEVSFGIESPDGKAVAIISGNGRKPVQIVPAKEKPMQKLPL